MSKALILSAHPDDEILGVGGTIQYLKEHNYKVIICLITDGSSTQYKDDKEKKELKDKEHKKALEILDVDDCISLQFADMQLDTVPHYQLNESISNIISKIKPNTIFTHSENDLNKDHQLIYNSTLVTTRPTNNFLKKVLSYEVLSSSEWNTEKPFIPNYFVDIEKYIEKKQKALLTMKTEIRKYPHPRSIEGIKILSEYRGLQCGLKNAEGFKIIKSYANK